MKVLKLLNMRSRNILLGFILLQFKLFFSQTPLSPEISNFTNMQISSINESKGLLNIEIPLHTINVDEYEIPIKLIYNSKGVKIEEESGNVGTSWLLNYGGVINREQHGSPDEYNQNYIIAPNYDNYGEITCQLLLMHNNTGWFQNSKLSNDVANDFFLNNGSLSQYTPNYISIFSPEPDIFKYYLPSGKQGSFIIVGTTYNGESRKVISSSNDLITYNLDNQGKLSNFTIIDDLGINYIFDIVEQRDNIFWNAIFKGNIETSAPLPTQYNDIYTSTVNFTPCVEGNNSYNSTPGVSQITNRPVNSAWFLSKIITTKGKEIIFSYENERHNQLSNTYVDYDEQNIRSYNNYNISTKYVTKRIVEINSPNEKIIFNYSSTKREDVREAFGLTGDIFNSSNNFEELKSLNSITIYANSLLTKSIQFINSYKSSNGIDNVANNLKYLYKRLWLDKIYINSLQEYQFEYYNGDIPNKFSRQQDYWGYFNGNNSDNLNKTLLPDLWYYPNNNRTITRSSEFSIFRRNSYNGNEFKISGYNRFDNVRYYVSNREADENNLKIGMLKKITYPTKGYEVYDYELNDFLFEGVVNYGAGLRLKKIEKFDHNNQSVSSKIFTYKLSNNSSSGVITKINSYGKISSIDNNSTRYYKIYSNSVINDMEVYYSRVEISENNNGGKVVNYYLIPYTIDSQSGIVKNGIPMYNNNLAISKLRIQCKIPWQCSIGDGGNFSMSYHNNIYEYPIFDINYNYENLFGKLNLSEFYDQNGNLTKTIETMYGLSFNSSIYRVYFGKSPNGNTEDNFIKTFFLGEYLVEKNIEKKYISSGNFIKEEQSFFYDSNNLLIEKSFSNSRGSLNKVKYNYARSDYRSNPFGLDDFHMLNYPINVYYFIDDVLVSKNLNLYARRMINNKEFIFKIKEMNFVVQRGINFRDGDDCFFPDNRNFGIITIDPRYETNKSYEYYDLENNNLIDFSDKAGNHTVWLWGYNGTKIIAEIKGLTINDIPQSTINNLKTLSNLDIDTSAENTLINALNNLRNSFPNAMVSTFTHDPLIGVTTITDPKGDTQYYTYDTFGRLQYVKDRNGNILSENEYHYKP